MTTTVVGSYPVPEWLKQCSDEAALGDALTVVMEGQRRAGVQVISDGELGRWDLERRAPGGMVERFVRPLDGGSTELTRGQLEKYLSRSEMTFRNAPPGVVIGTLGNGLLNLKRDWDRARARTDAPLKFTISSPYLIAKTVADDHYGDISSLTISPPALFTFSKILLKASSFAAAFVSEISFIGLLAFVTVFSKIKI